MQISWLPHEAVIFNFSTIPKWFFHNLIRKKKALKIHDIVMLGFKK